MSKARPPLHVVVIAAGKGRRMGTDVPKPLLQLGGMSMLARIVAVARRLKPAKIHIVASPSTVGRLRQDVAGKDVVFHQQRRQRGTADAALTACARIPRRAVALVLFGDLPLIQAAALRKVAAAATAGGLGLRTMRPPSATGYSRLVRDSRSRPQQLVVELQASGAVRAIDEVDAGGMAFPAGWGQDALARIKVNRASSEKPLTDLLGMAVAAGMPVRTVEVPFAQGLGVNTPAELCQAQSHLSAQTVADLAAAGVLFARPESVLVLGELAAAPGAFIGANVVFEGRVRLDAGSAVEHGCLVSDTRLRQGASLRAFTHAEGAVLHRGAQAGPFARLRPGAVLQENAKVGNFVEVKNTSVGRGAKASHLAYLGDGVIGARSNIGAGTVLCNYDGRNKHLTTIGDDVFVGSGSMLVAPVEIGANALIAAGSVVTKDVAAGQTAFGRVRQTNTARRVGPARKTARKPARAGRPGKSQS